MKKLIYCLMLATLLVVCGKKDVAPEDKPDAAAETKQDEKIVTLTKKNLENITLKTEPAQLNSLGKTLKAVGRISANLNKTVKVTPTLEGRVVKLNFDLNDTIKAGDIVALVESPELLGKAIELKSPMDGTVIERAVTAGELADKAKSIYTISDLKTLWVIAEVKERDIAAIKAGQDTAFTTLAYPDEKFHGKIELVGNFVEAGSRTVEVRIAVDNADGRLKPGMFADVEIVTTLIENVLLLPEGGLQTEGENTIVFVALDGNRFEKRVVKLGLEQSGRVQVLSGVKDGENIVTEGSFILKSELQKSHLGEE